MRYANISPTSVAEALRPRAVVTSVMAFAIAIPGCRGRSQVQDVEASFSDDDGAGDDAVTEATSDISPASMSSCYTVHQKRAAYGEGKIIPIGAWATHLPSPGNIWEETALRRVSARQ